MSTAPQTLAEKVRIFADDIKVTDVKYDTETDCIITVDLTHPNPSHEAVSPSMTAVIEFDGYSPCIVDIYNREDPEVLFAFECEYGNEYLQELGDYLFEVYEDTQGN